MHTPSDTFHGLHHETNLRDGSVRFYFMPSRYNLMKGSSRMTKGKYNSELECQTYLEVKMGSVHLTNHNVARMAAEMPSSQGCIPEIETQQRFPYI